MQSNIQLEISDLRQQNIEVMLESVSFFIATLVVASLLPNILIQYVYKDSLQMATETPFWLQNGPLIVFGLGLLFFVYAVISALGRNRKIKALKQQLSIASSKTTNTEAEIANQQAELAKLEKMVDEALDESEAKSGKKSTKAKKK